MIGIAKATKLIVEKLSPTPIISFNFFTTKKFKYNILELITGLKLILITTVQFTDNTNYNTLLEKIYGEVYVEYVTKNIMY